MNYQSLLELTGIFLLIFGTPVLIYLVTEWSINRKFRKTDEARLQRIEAGRDELNDLFVPNQEFCPECLTNEYFWVGGGSWSPDRCPNHRNSDDAILWKNMSKSQKKKAARKMDDGWHAKFGNHFFNEKQRKLYK